MDNLSVDAFYNGQVKVYQRKSGYRFSIDAAILASFPHLKPGQKVLDLGTGCGIVPILLTHKYPDVKCYGVEIQEGLFHIASMNVKENQMEDSISLFLKDMKKINRKDTLGAVDVVTCNPPYRKGNSGRINPDNEKALARHEITIQLHDVIITAYEMLKRKGKCIFIYIPDRIAEILSEMRSIGLEPKRLRCIHSNIFSEAKLILIEGVKGGGTGVKIVPPLYVYNPDGSYTPEMEKITSPPTY